MANRYARLGYLRSYEALKNTIYGGEVSVLPSPEFSSSSKRKLIGITKEKKADAMVDYSKDESMIIAIQNDPNLISIILKLRKQKVPEFYMFVENSYIVCIMKNPRTYPMILIRIPTDGIFTIAKDTSRVFNIPIKSLLEKSIKHNKNTPYSFILKNDGSSINLYYDHGQVQTHDLISNIKIYDRNSLEILFRSDISLINPDYDNFLYRVYSTSILILREVGGFILTKTKLNLELTPSSLTLVNRVGLEISTTQLAEKDNSLIWNINESKKFDAGSLDSLFKQDHFKDLKCKLYYAFGKFFDRYIFMKISTDEEISDGDSLIKIFLRGYHVIELYICSETG
jgi:hypothetical protein